MSKTPEEVLGLAREATCGPYHVEGHNYRKDVLNKQRVFIAESCGDGDAEYIASLSPEFIIKLIKDWKRLRDVLQDSYDLMMEKAPERAELYSRSDAFKALAASKKEWNHE